MVANATKNPGPQDLSSLIEAVKAERAEPVFERLAWHGKASAKQADRKKQEQVLSTQAKRKMIPRGEVDSVLKALAGPVLGIGKKKIKARTLANFLLGFATKLSEDVNARNAKQPNAEQIGQRFIDAFRKQFGITANDLTQRKFIEIIDEAALSRANKGAVPLGRMLSPLATLMTDLTTKSKYDISTVRRALIKFMQSVSEISGESPKNRAEGEQDLAAELDPKLLQGMHKTLQKHSGKTFASALSSIPLYIQQLRNQSPKAVAADVGKREVFKASYPRTLVLKFLKDLDPGFTGADLLAALKGLEVSIRGLEIESPKSEFFKQLREIYKDSTNDLLMRKRILRIITSKPNLFRRELAPLINPNDQLYRKFVTDLTLDQLQAALRRYEGTASRDTSKLASLLRDYEDRRGLRDMLYGIMDSRNSNSLNALLEGLLIALPPLTDDDNSGVWDYSLLTSMYSEFRPESQNAVAKLIRTDFPEQAAMIFLNAAKADLTYADAVVGSGVSFTLADSNVAAVVEEGHGFDHLAVQLRRKSNAIRHYTESKGAEAQAVLLKILDDENHPEIILQIIDQLCSLENQCEVGGELAKRIAYEVDGLNKNFDDAEPKILHALLYMNYAKPDFTELVSKAKGASSKTVAMLKSAICEANDLPGILEKVAAYNSSLDASIPSGLVDRCQILDLAKILGAESLKDLIVAEPVEPTQSIKFAKLLSTLPDRKIAEVFRGDGKASRALREVFAAVA